MPDFRFIDGVTAHDHGRVTAPTIMQAYANLFGEQGEPACSDYVWKLVTEFGAKDRYGECGGTHVYIGNRYLRTISYILVRKDRINEKTQTT